MKNLRGEQHDKRRDPLLQALPLVEFGRLGQAPDKRECNTKFVLSKQFTVTILDIFFPFLTLWLSVKKLSLDCTKVNVYWQICHPDKGSHRVRKVQFF